MAARACQLRYPVEHVVAGAVERIVVQATSQEKKAIAASNKRIAAMEAKAARTPARQAGRVIRLEAQSNC